MIDRGLKALTGRIQAMIGRAIIAAVDDATLAQSLQVDLLDGETQDGVEHFQTYGLTSVPPAGLEALVAFVGGLRSHGVVVAVGDRQYRLRGMNSGDVALYDNRGQSIVLEEDGIRIVSTGKVTIDAAEAVEVNATSAKVTADRVDIGGDGGAKVARVGDSVVDGVITTGSSKVFAA
ncbi:MAG: phage baseplate assembly protein V [Pseudomonadota bacterium]